MIKDDAVGVIVITENDDSAESTWLQKEHVDKHLTNFLPVNDTVLHRIEGNESNTAGNFRGNFKTKEGSSPSTSVMDIVLMAHVKMEIGEISPDKTYVIVNLGDKKFILTLRLVYELLRIFKGFEENVNPR